MSGLLRLMLSQGLKPDASTVSAVLSLKGGNVLETVDLVLGELTAWALAPNQTVTYNIIRACHQAGGNALDKTFQVIDRLKRRGAELGSPVLSELLLACTEQKRVEAATNVFMDMKARHLFPSTRAYAAFFRMMSSQPECKKDLVATVYQSLQLRGQPLSPHVLREVVTCLGHKGDVVALFDLYNRICRKPRYLDPKEEENRKAGAFLDEILFGSVAPMDLGLVTRFAAGFLRNGRHQIALDIIDDMSNPALCSAPPTDHVVCLFVDHLTEQKHMRFVELILRTVVKNKVRGLAQALFSARPVSHFLFSPTQINPTPALSQSLQKLYVRVRDMQGVKSNTDFAPDHPISQLLKGLTRQIQQLTVQDPLKLVTAQIASMGHK